jgi:hypothetical protein
MRMTVTLLVMGMLSTAAQAGGFALGGAADGMAVARDMELRDRAFELDRRYGTSTYEDLRRDQQIRDLQRAIDDNNRLLRDERARRGLLLPPLR